MIFGISSKYGEDNPYERLEDVTDKIKNYTKINNVAVTVRRTISSSETIIYAGYRQDDEFAISPQRQIQVVDRVGSGDAFSAGLIYAYNKVFNTQDSVDFASASSAFKHTVTKDINFATVEEINGLIHSQQYDVNR